MRPHTPVRSLSAGLLAIALAVGSWLSPAPSLAADTAAARGGTGTGEAAALSPGVTATNQIIVRWGSGGAQLAKSEALRTTLLARAIGSPVAFVRTGANGTAIYRLAARLGSRAATKLGALRRVQGIASVQPDRILHRSDAPSDPYAELQWSLLSPADGGSMYGMDPTAVWPTTTGTGVVVAVVDTGITDHLDLAGQTLPGYDMISEPMVAGDGDGRDANPTDEGDWDDMNWSSWHGTHVAGTIAALAGNGLGVFGAAPGVKILPVRVLGHGGGYETDIMDGVTWAAGGSVDGAPDNANPARVINLSLGGLGQCDAYSQAAIDTARAAGALVVVAAGNDDSDAATTMPANCAGVLAVAATDSSGHKAGFSNFGTTVGIAAPGVNILSTMNAGRTIPAPNPGGSVYATYSGTSMATPHVVAAAALLAAAYPDLSGDAIASLLRGSATPFPAHAAGDAEPCSVVGCGAGIVNVPAAFERLQSGPPIVDTPSLPSWTRGGHAITISATAISGAGIASAAAALDGGSLMAMTASDGSFGGTGERVELTVAAPMTEGPHTICVTAVAGSTLESTPACASFGVDSTVPTKGTARVSSTSVVAGQPVEISQTFADSTSGIASLSLTWDGTPVVASTNAGALGGASETALGIAGGGATSIVAGIGHSCVLTPGGAVACWGNNDAGQLGDGTLTSRSVARLVKVGGPAISVAGSAVHGCAVRADHHLVCWGTDEGGQFGTTSISGTPPMEIPGVTDAVSVAAGIDYTCYLHQAGTVDCLGTFMSSDQRVAPFAVDTSSLENVVAIAGGFLAACALIEDGTVKCWGAGPLGELGNAKLNDSQVPVTVSGVHDAIAISAGDEFACAIRSEGAVWCWGANIYGELGTVPSQLPSELPPHSSKPVRVPGPAMVTAVTAGFSHACATGPDATWCWGDNQVGELGTGADSDAEPPTQLSLGSIVSIAAGLGTTCAVASGGGVRCWGAAWGGMLGDGVPLASAPAAGEPTPRHVVGFGGAPSVGDHSLCLAASDPAGNKSAPTCRTVTVSATTASAPTAVTAQAGNGQVTVHWKPPTTGGGSPITGYKVTSSLVAGACTVNASARSCTFPGLTNGLVHVFTVRARTSKGLGDPATVAAIPAAGTVAARALTTGKVDVRHGRVPVLVTLGTSVPAATPGLAYRFAFRTATSTVPGQATSGATGLVSAPVGSALTYLGWATVGGAATPVVTSLPATVAATQDTSSALHFAGAWTRLHSTTAYGHSLRYASAAGRKVTFRVKGSSVAWVGAVGPNRGKARVYVDGHLRATVDLYAHSAALGRVVWASSLGAGTHTVKIVVLGTRNRHSRGTRVDVDAILRMS